MKASLLKILVPVLLAQAGLAVTAQQHAAIKAGSAAAAAPGAADPCVSAPTAAACSSYMYPQASAAADIAKLCSAMHFMAACSVAKACNASGAGPEGNPRGPGAAQISRKNPDVCDPFQHVTTVCKLDEGMSRMAGCNNFNTMCIAGSKVPACTATGLTAIPTSPKVNAQVRSICEEMTMDGCERCMPSWQAGKTWADCDLLDTYSYLCYQMPEMSQCTEWHAMCKADPTLKFCYPSPDPSAGGGGSSGGNGSSPAAPGPVMKMYFFSEMPFYLLFKAWTPRTNADLLGAWLAIFALGVLYEFLQMLYGKKEAEFWARRAAAGHSAAAAAAAAAASQRGMDEEAGGPLGEGMAKDSDTGPAGYPLPASTNGHSLSRSSPTPRPMPPSPPSGRPCCSSARVAASRGRTPELGKADSTASFGQGGYGSKGSSRGGVWGAVGYMQPELVAMDVVRGVSRFVLAGLAYLLMLAAMSFNVAIFFAVITGVGVGSMLFGRWRWDAGVSEGYSHCGCGSS